MMTQTLKIRRPIITERYRDIINGLFAWGRKVEDWKVGSRELNPSYLNFWLASVSTNLYTFSST
jgi:hypothetical protein